MADEPAFRGYMCAVWKDVECIEALAENFDRHIEAICFHAAQAAEKMAETVCLARGEQPEKTHNVRKLVSHAMDEGWVERDEQLLRDLVRFTEFNTSTKYATGPDVTKGEALEAVAVCNNVAGLLARSGHDALKNQSTGKNAARPGEDYEARLSHIETMIDALAQTQA